MTKMSKDPKIYSNLCDSIFPHVHGSEEIKKGLVLMLAGGVAKSTGEGFSKQRKINVYFFTSREVFLYFKFS